ncbi:MAG: hypothetical protein K6A92_11460 [Lachnospiraceae bacterium]|nr:hypothetical protein [Lachnospiraceae bacterium]
MKDKILPVCSILFCALMTVLVLFQMQKIAEELEAMKTYVSGMNSYLGVETEVTEADELVVTSNLPKKDDVDIQTRDMGDYILFTYTNNSSEVISYMYSDIVFYNAEGTMEALADDYVYNLFPGVPRYTMVYIPVNEDGSRISYNSFEITKHISEEPFRGDSMMQDVSFDYNVGANNLVLIKAENQSAKDLDAAEFQVIYYKDDEIFDVYTVDVYNIAAGEEGYARCEAYNLAAGGNFDRVEVILLNAYGNSGNNYLGQ